MVPILPKSESRPRAPRRLRAHQGSAWSLAQARAHALAEHALVRQARFAKGGGYSVALVGRADRKSFVYMRSAKVRLQLHESRDRRLRFSHTSGANAVHDQCSQRMSIGGKLN